MTWILIIILHGWGVGIGSKGNAVNFAEFSSQERCEYAITQIKKNLSAGADSATCVQK